VSAALPCTPPGWLRPFWMVARGLDAAAPKTKPTVKSEAGLLKRPAAQPVLKRPAVQVKNESGKAAAKSQTRPSKPAGQAATTKKEPPRRPAAPPKVKKEGSGLLKRPAAASTLKRPAAVTKREPSRPAAKPKAGSKQTPAPKPATKAKAKASPKVAASKRAPAPAIKVKKEAAARAATSTGSRKPWLPTTLRDVAPAPDGASFDKIQDGLNKEGLGIILLEVVPVRGRFTRASFFEKDHLLLPVEVVGKSCEMAAEMRSTATSWKATSGSLSKALWRQFLAPSARDASVLAEKGSYRVAIPKLLGPLLFMRSAGDEWMRDPEVQSDWRDYFRFFHRVTLAWKMIFAQCDEVLGLLPAVGRPGGYRDRFQKLVQEWEDGANMTLEDVFASAGRRRPRAHMSMRVRIFSVDSSAPSLRFGVPATPQTALLAPTDPEEELVSQPPEVAAPASPEFVPQVAPAVPAALQPVHLPEPQMTAHQTAPQTAPEPLEQPLRSHPVQEVQHAPTPALVA